jgi:hypothetical protein
MGWFEWLLLALIILYGHQTYQSQEYWLDRQISKFIRLIWSRFKNRW